MSEDFSQYPISLTERKSESSEKARDWTPRDVLIKLLRRIDSKEMDCDGLVVFYRARPVENRLNHVNYLVATPDPYVTQGLITMGAHRITTDMNS